MDCKGVKEFLKTDYTDGEAGAAARKEIFAHLRSCGPCRRFEEALRKTAVEPFKGAGEMAPPDSLWEGIRDRIERQESAGLPGALARRIRDAIYLRRPAFALAAAAAICLIAAVVAVPLFNGDGAVNGYLEEQVEFLSYLDNGGNGYADLDTAIEEYLL